MSNPNGSGAVRARRWPALVAVAVTASFAVAGLQAPGLPGGAQPAGAAVPPYQDTALPAEVRAADLVSRMTLGQKFEQLRAATESGTGNSIRYPGGGGYAPPIPELGVKGYPYWSESLHGVARASYNPASDYYNANAVYYDPLTDSYIKNPATPPAGLTRLPGLVPNDPANLTTGIATEFPTSLGLAASWNADLIKSEITAVSDEARAYTNARDKSLTYWSPTVNMDRDPRWGRAEETYGEDPHLTGVLGGSFVAGLQGQGEHPTYLKAIATAKHYLANDWETMRHTGSADLTERELREYYTPHYDELVSTYGAASMMTSYNAVNGVPQSANRYTVETLARRTFGFQGFITSDCEGILDVHYTHRHTATMEEGAAASIKAGTNVDCSAGEGYLPVIQTAVNQGLITEADIDADLVQVFTTRIRTGEFDPAALVPWTDASIYNIASQTSDPAHAAIAARGSEEGVVLLKNAKPTPDAASPLLPLPASTSDIVVVGYLADEVQHGGYSPVVTAVATKTAVEGITAAAQAANPGATVTHIRGIEATNDNTSVWAGYTPEANPSLRRVTNAAGQAVALVKPRLGRGTGEDPAPSPLEDVAVVRLLDAANQTVSKVVPLDIVEEEIAGWRGRRVGRPNANGYSDTGIFGGWFGVTIDIPAGATQVQVDQNGPLPGAAGATIIDPGGVFDVHLGAKDGPLLATVDAKGVNASVALPATTPRGEQKLWFVYRNDTYQVRSFTPAEESAIAAADVVIAFVGTRATESSEGEDRIDLDLPRHQSDLVSTVAALNPKTVAWIQGTEQVNVNGFNEQVASLAWTTYNGQASGDTVGRTLWGDSNPSGKLPFTWYKSIDDLDPPWSYSLPTTSTSKGRTYQYFTGDVVYPFGHGLTYSDLAYSDLVLSKAAADVNETVTATVTVTNPSPSAAQAVVELYASSPSADARTRPLKQLKGFDKVPVAPGAAVQVPIQLKLSDLWFWDEAAGAKRVDTGAWTIQVGPSSASGPSATLNVTGSLTPAIGQVVALPDGATLNLDAPANRIHANLSVTRADDSFYDLDAISVAYTSSDPSVAAVDATGAVRPVGLGAAQITATATADGTVKSATFPVAVRQGVAVNGTPLVELADATIPLSQAKSAGVAVAARLAPAQNRSSFKYRLAYYEPNTANGTVTEDGIVTATQVGTVRVTAIAQIPGATSPTNVRRIPYTATVRVVPDPDGSLGARVDQVSEGLADGAYQPDNFTASSFSALTAALAGARAVLGQRDPSAAVVDAALASLNSAVAGLVPRGSADAVQAAIAAAEALGGASDQFTAETWQRVADAIVAAQALLGSPAELSKTAADAATADLSTAIAGLVAKPAGQPGEGTASARTALATVLTGLTALKAAAYTPASYGALATAVLAARVVANNPTATADQLRTALQSVAAAVGGLVPADSGGAAPGAAVVKTKVSQSVATLVKGKSITLAAKGYTAAGAARNVKWTSSKKSVATVNAKGKITAKKTGKATITATVDGKSAKVKVTVVAKAKKAAKVTASVPKSLKVGAVAYITGKAGPAKATGAKVAYASSAKSVLTVAKTGRVVAKTAGQATITVKIGRVAKKYKVTVTP